MARAVHVSPECSIFAEEIDAGCHDIGWTDYATRVFRHGVECGDIIARFDDWENTLTYIPSAGLPDWIVGLYTGEDYPDSALAEGYTFSD